MTTGRATLDANALWVFMKCYGFSDECIEETRIFLNANGLLQNDIVFLFNENGILPRGTDVGLRAFLKRRWYIDNPLEGEEHGINRAKFGISLLCGFDTLAVAVYLLMIHPELVKSGAKWTVTDLKRLPIETPIKFNQQDNPRAHLTSMSGKASAARYSSYAQYNTIEDIVGVGKGRLSDLCYDLNHAWASVGGP